MIKTACASDFNKKNPRPPNSGTVILITRGPPYKWLDYDEYIHILSPQQEYKEQMDEQQEDREGLDNIFIRIQSADERRKTG